MWPLAQDRATEESGRGDVTQLRPTPSRAFPPSQGQMMEETRGEASLVPSLGSCVTTDRSLTSLPLGASEGE